MLGWAGGCVRRTAEGEKGTERRCYAHNSLYKRFFSTFTSSTHLPTELQCPIPHHQAMHFSSSPSVLPLTSQSPRPPGNWKEAHEEEYDKGHLGKQRYCLFLQALAPLVCVYFIYPKRKTLLDDSPCN